MLTRSLARPGLVLLTALLALCPPVLAQRLGSISGIVATGPKKSGIEGARVLLVGTSFIATTNTRGEFSFKEIIAGKYVIQASAIGFQTLTAPIEVKHLEVLRLEFNAEAQSVRLPDLEVAENSNLAADFLRRSQEGGGRYFHRAEIAARHPPSVGDLLRSVPGMRVDCRGPICGAVFSRSSRGCLPAYYMDGAPTDASVVWLQPPGDLEGVEIYSGPATVPPELNRPGACGAIALWTRVPPPRVRKEKKPKPPDSLPF